MSVHIHADYIDKETMTDKENHAREIIATAVDEDLWDRKVWKPPNGWVVENKDCMSTDKKENKRMRTKIAVFSDGRGGLQERIIND